MSLIFHLFFLCLILSMTSCSGKSDYQFKDSTDALKQYRDFHHRIAEEHQANAELNAYPGCDVPAFGCPA